MLYMDYRFTAILFDWSMWAIGVGVQDLLYMIGIIMSSNEREMMEIDFVKHYYNNLIKFGVENYKILTGRHLINTMYI